MTGCSRSETGTCQALVEEAQSRTRAVKREPTSPQAASPQAVISTSLGGFRARARARALGERTRGRRGLAGSVVLGFCALGVPAMTAVAVGAVEQGRAGLASGVLNAAPETAGPWVWRCWAPCSRPVRCSRAAWAWTCRCGSRLSGSRWAVAAVVASRPGQFAEGSRAGSPKGFPLGGRDQPASLSSASSPSRLAAFGMGRRC